MGRVQALFRAIQVVAGAGVVDTLVSKGGSVYGTDAADGVYSPDAADVVYGMDAADVVYGMDAADAVHGPNGSGVAVSGSTNGSPGVGGGAYVPVDRDPCDDLVLVIVSVRLSPWRWAGAAGHMVPMGHADGLQRAPPSRLPSPAAPEADTQCHRQQQDPPCHHSHNLEEAKAEAVPATVIIVRRCGGPAVGPAVGVVLRTAAVVPSASVSPSCGHEAWQQKEDHSDSVDIRHLQIQRSKKN
eukprot:CAMPEP_0174352224 /NCGR_PEP_ID=MMETSP0811_2-20130205/9827_1 /TAXON_ID=73025 ORGANISM="Eutreptiella gymnastica-like, Strain CCMP1594" /NCGR_SAMPLE_ID=MMETSP0811_2 /ASSEMBLY_ACC=CAM_ASM_000667 /LENGTH=241 /DNA_ID=CAMNT_0015482225 /DNA_START=1359 /DNA_END=2081 /DNA_ORIENTATION=+